MRSKHKLFLICGLLSLGLFTTVPARAQSDYPCLNNPRTLIVSSDVILGCLRAGQSVNFYGVKIEGDLDLTSLNENSAQSISISSVLVIRNSRFTGSLISFNGDNETVAIFQGKVDLQGSQFDERVDFTGATFEEFAHFENIQFSSGANFTQAIFQNGASFNDTTFNNSSSFMLANISGGIDFSDSEFFILANFSWLHSTQGINPLLPSDILFSRARFIGAVYFMDAVFENQVLFNDAVFSRISPEDTVIFTNAIFTTLDLTNASFESGQLKLSERPYKALIMPNFHPSILSTQNSVEGLSIFKDNLRRQGRLDLANEITYWQNCVQRQEKHILPQILETVFLDWTFGYGLKPLHSVKASIILILLFAIFYYPAGTLRAATFAPTKPRERRFTIRLSEIPIEHNEDIGETLEKNHQAHPLPPQITQLWQAITFSFGVFTKLNSGKYVAVRAGSLVIAEWIIGLMVMAGFLFSLANTNALLRSVLELFR
jgi:uncharacterized protein YjbI with pentapeptide repeats